MASAQLTEEIEKTQNVLSFIKPPPTLSTKLLSKPPFKFIHDIVTQAMRTLDTIPQRLFTPTQLDRNAFTEREEKKVFLEKLIEWTYLLTGSRIDVNPRNIISGHEPEKTNRLLQALGKSVRIAEGEPKRAEVAADKVNGKAVADISPTPAAAAAGKRRQERDARTKTQPDKERRRRRPAASDDEQIGPNIIEDRPDGHDDDDKDFQVVNVKDGVVRTKNLQSRIALRVETPEPEDAEHGILVRKILEMKRGIDEMERKAHEQDDAPSAAAGEEDRVDREQRDREMIRFRREIADVRRKIQALSGSVVPLGKEMDEVQIAIDTMIQEHAQSRRENNFLREQLRRERNGVEAHLDPLKVKLRMLQAELEDQTERIRSQKRGIKLTDDRIERMIEKTLQAGKDGQDGRAGL